MSDIYGRGNNTRFAIFWTVGGGGVENKKNPFRLLAARPLHGRRREFQFYDESRNVRKRRGGMENIFFSPLPFLSGFTFFSLRRRRRDPRLLCGGGRPRRAICCSGRRRQQQQQQRQQQRRSRFTDANNPSILPSPVERGFTK